MAQQAYPPCKNPRAASHFRGANRVLERINPKLHLNNYAFDIYKPYPAPIHSDNLSNTDSINMSLLLSAYSH
jgi:hypothetical protein